MHGLEAHVVAGLAGAGLALIVPPLFEGGPLPFSQAVQKIRESSASWRRGKKPIFWAIVVVLALGGFVTRADDAWTVKLQRQQIPLHSIGGVMYHKSAYYGPIFVGGAKPQRFDVVFDTGSGHLVLPSTMCHSETCRMHRRYRRRASPTAKDIDYDGTAVQSGQPRDQITVAFGTGEVTGVFVEDTVCLQGIKAQPVGVPPVEASLMQSKFHATNKTVVQESNASKEEACIRLRTVAATEMTHEPFSSFEFDGVLGLGLPGLSQTPEFNFFNVATLSGAVQTNTSHLFTVFLATSDLEQSDITFGGMRMEHIADGAPKELGWCDVVKPELGYWQLQVHAIRAGDTVLPYCQDGTCRAVVDTGTSLVGVPSDVAPFLRNALQHPQGPTGGCHGPGPELEFDLGNFSVVLRPEDYARPDMPDDNDDEASDPSVDCVPMMMLMDLPEPLGPKLFILGEPVLQRYYTGFDSKNHRVGFALAKHATQSAVHSEELVTV